MMIYIDIRDFRLCGYPVFYDRKLHHNSKKVAPDQLKNCTMPRGIGINFTYISMVLGAESAVFFIKLIKVKNMYETHVIS